MKQTIAAINFRQRIAAPIASPSPLVGEGITAGQRELGRVRGFDERIAMVRQPLIRRDTHCVRIAPPSPTRGEGKRPAIHGGGPA